MDEEVNNFKDANLMGFGPNLVVTNWLRDYFGISSIDLSEFVTRDTEYGVELITKDGLRGYFFGGSNCGMVNYKAVNEKIRKDYTDIGREIVEEFFDDKNQIAGLSWRVLKPLQQTS